MKTCKQCSTGFEVTDADRAFYVKMDVPEPSLCPDCRRQRRLAWRNEHSLFSRKCDLCQKKIISNYPADTKFPVYCNACWWSDGWDPMAYSRDVDFSRSFFDQLHELRQVVPRVAMLQFKNENSEYTNCVTNLKDCYLLFSSDFNQNCLYGVWNTNSQDCVDNLMVTACQLTYESVYSQNLHNTSYALFSSQCSDSAFLMDCRNCSNCFMCFGLRNKQYHIANKAYSKEEYFEKLKEFPMSSGSNLEKAKAHFFELMKSARIPDLRKRGTVIDSTGNYLTDTVNCVDCYEVNEGRDCRFVVGGFQIKDAMDCCYVNGEKGYENSECFPMPLNAVGCVNSYEGADHFYTDNCMNNCTNCFGCIGLKHAEYSILNKKYSKEDYFAMVARIKEMMKKDGEWGEFQPMKNSPFAYNASDAQAEFPLTEGECAERGLRWRPRDEREYQPQAYVVSDDIREVKDDITGQILACADCGKNYKIIVQELDFYRKKGLPVPRRCPECRLTSRDQWRKKRRLYERACASCKALIQTTYAPDRPETVCCEKCYLDSLK